MMTTYELRSLLRGEMTNAGFARGAGVWTRKTGDLLWIAQLDRSPYGQRYSIDIGVALIGDSGELVPAKAGDCPIVMHLENLPLTGARQVHDARFNDFRSIVIIGFDLTSDIEDEERSQLIASAIEALGRYVDGIDDLRDLRERFRAGDLDSAFISKDVRRVLSSDNRIE